MCFDPYLLDVLGLRENYLEADSEKAILAEKVLNDSILIY
jgi:predicted nuclease of restriction endonuclease-like (RecB) superfamily